MPVLISSGFPLSVTHWRGDFSFLSSSELNNLTWRKWNILEIWIIIYHCTHLWPLQPVMFSVPPLFLLIRDSQKDLLEVKSTLQWTSTAVLYMCSAVWMGWWAMSCDWMWLGANNGRKWHVWLFFVMGSTLSSNDRTNNPSYDMSPKGSCSRWWKRGGCWLYLRKARRLWIKRDK